jgi:ABC-type microcin C transport system duplicated ATPase subunit YejF
MRNIILVLTLLALLVPAAFASEATPQPMKHIGDNFFVDSHQGRLFITGSAESHEKFLGTGHLPYTRTLLGAGPMGETVIFEVNKKDPALAERLQETFLSTSFLVAHSGEDFFVQKYKERLYVLGSKESNQSFMAHKHLPYTRTILGAGPQGETVVFEVNKKDPAYVQRLEETFAKTPLLVAGNNHDLFVYKMGERIYVIGQSKTSESFQAHHHLPYTRTLLGAGPQGETVVFEVDKKNPALADRLVSEYL